MQYYVTKNVAVNVTEKNLRKIHDFGQKKVREN